MRPLKPLVAFAGGILVTAACFQADAAERLSLRAEAGGGTTLSPDLRERDLELAQQGSLRPGFSPAEALVIEGAFSHWAFPRSGTWGRATLAGGGLRTEPLIAPNLRFLLDGHAGVGFTGDSERLMLDAGLGLDWSIARAFGFGPAVRYSQIATQQGDAEASVNFWSAGLGFTLRIPESKAPTERESKAPTDRASPPKPPARVVPADSDADHVLDPEDQCPDLAQGRVPDPTRLGCPDGDEDKDGVFDQEDQCRALPAGANPDAQRKGCPDGDDDLDGVSNRKDECPTIASGLNPDPTRAGCPKMDRDGDSVPDDVDACPEEPGAPQADPARNGCPGLVEIKDGDIETLKPVYFATSQDRLLKKSFPVLKAVAEVLREMPGIRLISIEGHADGRGTDDFNLDLSRRRAENVMKYLIEQGVEPERLEVHGFGKSQPAESNVTIAGRARNRRVEFHIVSASTNPE